MALTAAKLVATALVSEADMGPGIWTLRGVEVTQGTADVVSILAVGAILTDGRYKNGLGELMAVGWGWY